MFGRIKYIKAKKAGAVTLVQKGLVEVDGRKYNNLKATFVQPGQHVKVGQVIGKK